MQILDELRARTGTFLTVVALTTTFLVALTSTSDRPPIAQQPTELAALALFGVSVICMSVVLVPWFRWHFYARPGVVRRQIERGLTASEIRDQRARKIPKDLAKDQGRIVLLQWIFIFGIGAFIAEVICWAVSIL